MRYDYLFIYDVQKVDLKEFWALSYVRLRVALTISLIILIPVLITVFYVFIHVLLGCGKWLKMDLISVITKIYEMKYQMLFPQTTFCKKQILICIIFSGHSPPYLLFVKCCLRESTLNIESMEY